MASIKKRREREFFHFYLFTAADSRVRTGDRSPLFKRLYLLLGQGDQKFAHLAIVWAVF
jgi:hypothetical protein